MILNDPIVEKSGWGLWSKYTLKKRFIFCADISGYHIETEYVTLYPEGTMLFKKGYEFAASGPTWDTPNCRMGVIIHDSLYLMIRMGRLPKSYRKLADDYLYDLLRLRGMFVGRAYRWWVGVRLFGWMSV